MTKHVRLVDPSDLQGCEFEWRYTEEGEKVRVSIRTGRIIPVPESNNQTHDYKTKGAYIEREKDTTGMHAMSYLVKRFLSFYKVEYGFKNSNWERQTKLSCAWY